MRGTDGTRVATGMDTQTGECNAYDHQLFLANLGLFDAVHVLFGVYAAVVYPARLHGN